MMPNPTQESKSLCALYFGHMYCMDGRKKIDQYQVAIILGR